MQYEDGKLRFDIGKDYDRQTLIIFYTEVNHSKRYLFVKLADFQKMFEIISVDHNKMVLQHNE